MDIEPSLRWRARATPRHVLPSYSSHRPSHVAGMVAGLLKGQSGSGWLSLGFVLRVLGVFLRSHSRPEHAAFGRRKCMLSRPSHERPTGRKRTVNFLNSPTRPGTQGRTGSAKARKLRHSLKQCKRPQKLMNIIHAAISDGILEPSVVGAAMQTCGFMGWWNELLELLTIQQEQGVVLTPSLHNIALTALSGSLRKRGAFGIVGSRAAVALTLAKRLGREAEAPPNPDEFNCGLSSALKLATNINSDAACAWGCEVWEQSKDIAFPKSKITHSTYIQFLEQYEHCEEVDAILEADSLKKQPVLNYVVLGGLLDCVSSRKDWNRAEGIWEMCMQNNIEPNLICFRARAKVHLLAGRPTMALQVLQSALDMWGLCIHEDARTATEYAQSLLIVCHSSLDPAAMEHLQTFLKSGYFRVEAESTALIRSCLLEMEAGCRWSTIQGAIASWDVFSAFLSMLQAFGSFDHPMFLPK
ncbi:unnamed protein product [Durusdinium trenchii]|uniref:Uncharacterized protein n=1 Tax=Durusdinium trenchii TaxID=1381693 RepID=A0ABP0SC18_9DINO